MQKRTNQATFAVLAMLTFWLTIHTVKLNTIVPDYEYLTKTMNSLMNRVIGAEEFMRELESKKGELDYKKLYEKQIDSLTPFGEKFNEMREVYGAGYTFHWNGEYFTTYYAEEINNNQTR
tara:strand:- start:201 stop:560 length:360 start_codon:yes stop_codon:yes gene_type:complete